MHSILDAGRLEILRWPDFAKHRNSVREFYELNHDSLGWIWGEEATPQALALISLLQQSDSKGLDPDDYDGPRWTDRLARLRAADASSESVRVQFDVALTVSAIRYASDLSIGRVNPREVNCDFDVEQNRCDLAEFLHRALLAQDVSAQFRELDPPFDVYRRTEDALHVYRQLARNRDQPALAPVRKTIKPGDVYPNAPELARFLKEVGDLTEELSFSQPAIYQSALAAAVQRFQRRDGLEANGWLTPKTIAALNVPIPLRERQLELALERLRWLPRSYARPPIVVNVPEFRLHALDERYKSAWATNVVVGKAYQHRTPVFAGEMRYLVFRPYWNVPNSIAREELLPKIEENPGYLRENDYEVVDRSGQIIDANRINKDALDQVRSGTLRIRQRPGEKNALGLVKFAFPNEHDVYMHSTPARELFSIPRRDFSHGCIRVEHAGELAAWCLRAKPGWDIERIRAAMYGANTVRVDLDPPIPVLIVYGTAIASADRTVHFYADIYGYDTQLARALASRHP